MWTHPDTCNIPTKCKSEVCILRKTLASPSSTSYWVPCWITDHVWLCKEKHFCFPSVCIGGDQPSDKNCVVTAVCALSWLQTVHSRSNALQRARDPFRQAQRTLPKHLPRPWLADNERCCHGHKLSRCRSARANLPISRSQQDLRGPLNWSLFSAQQSSYLRFNHW